MSAAFAVAAAVALLAIVALVLTTRRTAARVAAERSRADELEAELRSARDARSQAEHQLQQDELALGVAVERADVSERRASHAEGRLATADTLWELERLRLEREWREVTGTPTPLPERWDGSIRAAIAVELEIIREVIGIPTRLEPDGHGSPPADSGALKGEHPPGAGRKGPAVNQNSAPPPDPIEALGAARLTGEILRSLARVSEEMAVSIDPDGSVTMVVATEGAGPAPDLGRLTRAAAALGGELTVRPVADGLQARLRTPLSSS